MITVSLNGLPIRHGYPFDPTYGYSEETLLQIAPPDAPEEFARFWTKRYERARNQPPAPTLNDTGKIANGWKIYDLVLRSTDAALLGGWAIAPANKEIRRGFVAGHGYGGREEPDLRLPFDDAAILFPCSRGISRSRLPGIPSEPNKHVAHRIEDKENYVIGGCVDDLWVSVSALEELFPETVGKIGLLGVSFSGGITALAAPWDPRVSRSHVNVPTFGHQALRLKLPTVGSGAGAQQAHRRNPATVEETLRYHDAAIAAKFLRTPIHFACALFDPAVAPPGQFAIHNAVDPNLRERFTLTAGHHEYPGQAVEDAKLLQEIYEFFSQETPK